MPGLAPGSGRARWLLSWIRSVSFMTQFTSSHCPNPNSMRRWVVGLSGPRPPSSYCACPSHAPAVLDGVTPNQAAVAACRLADLAGARWAAGAPRSLKTKARDERQWGCQWGLEGKVLLLWPRGPALLRVKCLIWPLLIREAGHAGGFGGHGRHHHGHRPEAQGEVPRMQSEWAGPRGPARGMGAPRDTTPRRSDQPDAGERV